MTTTLTPAWCCYQCDETGTGKSADRAAEKHTKATGHATTTSHRGEITSMEEE